MSSDARPRSFVSIRLALVALIAFAAYLGGTGAARPDPPGAASPADPLPPGARFRLGDLRYRHPQGITSSALSSDGRQLATAGNGHVAVWDLATGTRSHFFRNCGVPRPVGEGHVAFSPDGKKLAHACAFDVAARIWDLNTGKMVQELGALAANIAPADRPGRVKVISMGPRSDPTGALRFSQDGKELTVCGDTRLSLFDLPSGTRRKRADLPATPLAHSADGQLGAGLIDDDGRTVLIWSAKLNQEVARLALRAGARGEWLVRMAFAPDGKTLAVAENQKGMIHVWSLPARKWVGHFPLRAPAGPHRVTTLHHSPDGRTLFAGTQEGDILRLNASSGESYPPLKGHCSDVTGLHFRDGGRSLVTASLDGTVRRWDLVRGEEVPLPDGYAGAVSMAVSPEGKRVAVGDRTGRLDLWDAETGRRTGTFRAGPGVHKLAFAPDGDSLAAACCDGVVRLLDPVTGKATASLSLPNDRKTVGQHELTCLAFSPDGRRLLTGSRLNGLRVWDTASGKPLWSASAGDFGLGAFSPDGKRVVLGGADARLSCRDAATGEEIFGVPVSADPDRGNAPAPGVVALTYSPDGRLLAGAHQDGTIRLWDAASGKELRRQRAQPWNPRAVGFSPDGWTLAVGGSDGTVRLWELLTGREARKFVGHDGSVAEVAFGPDARTVLAGGDVEALVWDVRPVVLASGDLNRLWEGLQSTDAALAQAAVWALAGRAKEASALLRRKIAPVSPEKADECAPWIAALDSPRRAVREEATQILAKRGDAATPALRAAMTKSPSPEVRRRLDFLLNPLHREVTPEELLRSRAVQVLELAATPEARQVLQDWSSGAAGAGLTEDARAALERLKARR